MMEDISYNTVTLDKFTYDKKMKYFPGVTIVHNINDQSLVQTIIAIKNEYKSLSFYDKLVFLPEDSYHMTIAGIITYPNRFQKSVFVDFPKLTCKEDEIDDYVVEKLEDIYSNLKVTMVFNGVNENKILLKPKTDRDYYIINEYRKTIYSNLNIKVEEDYQFHISLSYTLIDLSSNDYEELSVFQNTIQEKYSSIFKELKISNPTLAFFNDMSEFRDYTKGRGNLGNY